MKGMIREILNKIKWTEEDNYNDYLIIFIHRGAPNNQKQISFDQIVDITPSFFAYNDRMLEEDTYIPFHRIIKIINVIKNEILWSKN